MDFKQNFVKCNILSGVTPPPQMFHFFFLKASLKHHAAPLGQMRCAQSISIIVSLMILLFHHRLKEKQNKKCQVQVQFRLLLVVVSGKTHQQDIKMTSAILHNYPFWSEIAPIKSILQFYGQCYLYVTSNSNPVVFALLFFSVPYTLSIRVRLEKFFFASKSYHVHQLDQNYNWSKGGGTQHTSFRCIVQKQFSWNESVNFMYETWLHLNRTIQCNFKFSHCQIQATITSPFQ